MKQSLKFTIAFITCFFLRLIPFRPANVEPIMGTMMPFAKKYGLITSVLFSFGSIMLYDAVTAFGTWTWSVAIVYALVSIGATFYFKNRDASRANFVIYAIIGTLVFDALTGPIIPSVFQHGNFWALTVAQVPFTLSHLAGNIIFAAVLSPLIMKYFVLNPYWDLPSLAELKQKQPAN